MGDGGARGLSEPWSLISVDPELFDQAPEADTRWEVLEKYKAYMAPRLQKGVPLKRMAKHLLGLFQGEPGARLWRRTLSEQVFRFNAGLESIEAAEQAWFGRFMRHMALTILQHNRGCSSRRSRRILSASLGVVLISIVAILFWALVLFNWTNHRDRISDWIQTRTGVEMVFEGPIVLDVGFPSDAFLGLSVGIQSATIRSISGVMPSQPMTINRFSVAFSLEDLRRVLRGEGICAEGMFDVAEIDIRTLTTDLAIDWSIFLPQAFRHA